MRQLRCRPQLHPCEPSPAPVLRTVSGHVRVSNGWPILPCVSRPPLSPLQLVVCVGRQRLKEMLARQDAPGRLPFSRDAPFVEYPNGVTFNF